MAERRMFAKTIIDSDAFLDMPMSAQLLYFHLSMRADDEGFLNNPKKIQRMIGASEDDLKLLVLKKFILHFDSGVIVMKHWKINNYLQNDRCKPTIYQKEKSMLGIKANKAYTLNFDDPSTKRIQDVSKKDTKRIQDVSSSYTECIQDGYSLDTDCIHENSEKEEKVLSQANKQNDETCINADDSSMYTECIQDGYKPYTQVRLGKVRKDININNIHSIVKLGYRETDANKTDLTELDESKILTTVQEKWNSLQDIGLETIRQIKTGSKRAKKVIELVQEYGIDSFDEAIRHIVESDFLTGHKEGSTWKIDFDWLTESNHFADVLDDAYKDYEPFPTVQRGRKKTFNQMQSSEQIDFKELEAQLLDN